MLKRLIEVALPLKEVSEQSAREKSIRHGHISTLHIWWARRPLAACRSAALHAPVQCRISTAACWRLPSSASESIAQQNVR
ncbi:MAG: DUF1156 domain-containing protein [Planctomycetia bacterium]|nr:DUF1156 domain-containing protein [Planctomycetia bacterium]